MMTNILVADDDAGYRYPLVHLFEDCGFHVEEADSLQGVMERAPRADVWIIDVRLPTGKMEGIEAVQELANKGFIPRFPVIFISVLDKSVAKEQLDILDEKKVGWDWVEKPFEPELLYAKIRDILKGQSNATHR